MKKYRETIILGSILIGLSIVLHGVHFAMFKDMHHIMIFLVADIAFIPLEVFFVSLVLEKVIDSKEKSKIQKKMDMLIGLFYTEIGNELLGAFVAADSKVCTFTKEADVTKDWKKDDFLKLSDKMKARDHAISQEIMNYDQILEKLNPHKHLFITLISSPILHEHEDFSNLLMTVFHLHDELKTRLANGGSQEDFDHLKFDAERVYTLLASQWVLYMVHLKEEYPYLYATAIKDNPYVA